MGAGVLPTTIYDGKLYFLFGKENKFADTPGWSDFGGGTEPNESFLTTAIREAGEEMTGFLGSPKEVRDMLTRRGIYYIDLINKTPSNKYRMYLLPMQYSEALPHYYNNNQRFLQKYLEERVLRETKIFEKAEIRWICVDNLLKQKSQFRSYFQEMIMRLVKEKEQIYTFMEKAMTLDKSKNLHKVYKMGAYMSSSSKKGTPSQTHKGRKNYTTKKGDLVFHQDGHYVYKSRRPYMGKRKGTRKNKNK